jgi:hypothetical protein
MRERQHANVIWVPDPRKLFARCLQLRAVTAVAASVGAQAHAATGSAEFSLALVRG